VAFAALALLATLWAAVALRGTTASMAEAVDRLRPSQFVCPRSGPLLAGAFLIGLGSSVYWTFAVDLVADEGGVAPSAARLVLAVVGAASLALIAAAPGAWPAVVPSAILFGAAYNVLLAVDAIWSARVYAGRPATGLAAVMFTLAVGLLVGPAGAGAMAASARLPAAFFAGAAVIAVTSLLTPAEDLAVSSA
jgi:hypothetical protein